jgi:hypothetical protein
MDPAWFVEKVMRDRFPTAAKVIFDKPKKIKAA